jgi:hypothetical protein
MENEENEEDEMHPLFAEIFVHTAPDDLLTDAARRRRSRRARARRLLLARSA